MATFKPRGAVSTEITFTVTEEEARALDALVGYGFDGFIKVFYQHMGQHYMKPHEAGLRSLFKAIREEIPIVLARADLARAAFNSRDVGAAEQALRALDHARTVVRSDTPVKPEA